MDERAAANPGGGQLLTLSLLLAEILHSAAFRGDADVFAGQDPMRDFNMQAPTHINITKRFCSPVFA